MTWVSGASPAFSDDGQRKTDQFSQTAQFSLLRVSQAANICSSSSTLLDKSSLGETRFDDCALMMMIVVVNMNSGRVSSIGQSDC